MPNTKSYRFYLSIVLPSILAILFFVISIFTLILPAVEQNIMEKKKEMISELTHTVWSLLDEYNQASDSSSFDQNIAQELVLSKIEKIRYGGENKDYFWIIDEHPNMIMHPYRGELLSTDLNEYADANGKKLFVEATVLVDDFGEGFINYMWQWKDDSSRIVPKLSYVKAYKPWNWIIGTGIYLEDVKEEINILRNHLLRITFLISAFIAAVLIFIIRQSLKIEQKRREANNKLKLSRQKYKSLVAASTEGTLMILNREIIYANLKFSHLSGFAKADLYNFKFEDLFVFDWKELQASFLNPEKSMSLETQLKCSNGSEKDVILSVSKIKYDEDHGYIIIAKEISTETLISKENEHLSQELQTSLLLMHQPIKPYITSLLKCSGDNSIQEVVELMFENDKNVIFVEDNEAITGVVNSNDLKNRVLAANIDTKQSVLQIMSYPVLTISENALLYEGILFFKRKNISHIACVNTDGKIIGEVSYTSLLALQQNAVSFMIKEIEKINDTVEMHKIQPRLAVLVNALVESGDKPHNISRIITSISDAIVHRIISISLAKLGIPPCSFAFMVMGSEGRREQTLSTDQDNAIVFENLEGEKLVEASEYFLKLGNDVCQMLSEAGYTLCSGDVMAQNPKWNQPLNVWKQHFSTWLNSSDPQSILDSSIFFDFRTAYGNTALVNELRLSVYQDLKHKPVFFHHLALSIINYKAPINIFGKIINENQNKDIISIDIKKILLPVVCFVRLYALNTNIYDTNTLDRLEHLYLKQIIDKKMYDNIVLAYNYLMHIRYRSQARQSISNQIPDNNINIDTLTHIEISTIKKIFEEIALLQSKLSFDYKGSM